MSGKRFWLISNEEPAHRPFWAMRRFYLEGIWTYDGTEFDVYDPCIALRSLTVVSFVDEAPTGQEEISLTLHLDNKDFPTFTLTLYRYDGENCIATVDNEPVTLVSRSQGVNLTEAVRTLTPSV